MREQLDTVATLREAAEALRDLAGTYGDAAGERAVNLADRLDGIADRTKDKPVAWTSQTGVIDLGQGHEEGRSHVALSCRVDRHDDYNNVPLYLSPCPTQVVTPSRAEKLRADPRTPNEIAQDGIAAHLDSVKREAQGRFEVRDMTDRVLRCAIREGRRHPNPDGITPFYVLAALREIER